MDIPCAVRICAKDEIQKAIIAEHLGSGVWLKSDCFLITGDSTDQDRIHTFTPGMISRAYAGIDCNYESDLMSGFHSNDLVNLPSSRIRPGWNTTLLLSETAQKPFEKISIPSSVRGKAVYTTKNCVVISCPKQIKFTQEAKLVLAIRFRREFGLYFPQLMRFIEREARHGHISLANLAIAASDLGNAFTRAAVKVVSQGFKSKRFSFRRPLKVGDRVVFYYDHPHFRHPFRRDPSRIAGYIIHLEDWTGFKGRVVMRHIEGADINVDYGYNDRYHVMPID